MREEQDVIATSLLGGEGKDLRSKEYGLQKPKCNGSLSGRKMVTIFDNIVFDESEFLR